MYIWLVGSILILVICYFIFHCKVFGVKQFDAVLAKTAFFLLALAKSIPEDTTPF